MRLKKLLRDLITDRAHRAKAAGQLTFETLPAFEIEAPRQAEHGDLATNLALVLPRHLCRVGTAHQFLRFEL